MRFASWNINSVNIRVETLLNWLKQNNVDVICLQEIKCETDFVGKTKEFAELGKNISMQIAACSNVEYVTVDDIPKNIVDNEKSIEMGRDDLSGKPDQIKTRIVEGRIGKRLKEMALLEQPFIRDSSITVEELVKQVAGKIGENIKVRRFNRYTLGEGIEVAETDFAAEVAATVGAK